MGVDLLRQRARSACAALALAPILLAESSDAHGQSHDVPGAVLVTAGLSLLVLGITQGQQLGLELGRDDRRVRCAAVVLLGSFVALGAAADAIRSCRSRSSGSQTLTAANVAGFIIGTALFSMFLMLTLYMQQVLGYSPMKTGVAYLAVAGTAVIWANVAAAAVNRVGVKPALILGMGLLTVGLLYFTQVSVGRLLLDRPLPRLPDPRRRRSRSRSCRSRSRRSPGTKPHEAGLASGLINTSQQIGGAVGIALLSTIAVSTTDDEVASGTQLSFALTDGFVNAFWAGAAIAFAGVLVSIFMVRGRDLRPQEVPVAEPAFEGGAA